MQSQSTGPIPPISDAESAVMEVIWHSNPLAADEIVRALARERDWAEPTVKSLINRLLKKGAISAQPDGRRYLYAPVLRRADWLSAESTGLLDRLFGGRVAPLVAHFGESGHLSARDLSELKQLIAELEK